jgi:tetratricopeptide (TPR) repeat protein
LHRCLHSMLLRYELHACIKPFAMPCTCAEAIRRYDEAIAGAPNDATLLGNRSAAYLALGLYREAKDDALRSTELNASWAKGHFRWVCNCTLLPHVTGWHESAQEAPCRKRSKHVLEQARVCRNGAGGVGICSTGSCDWAELSARQQGHGEQPYPSADMNSISNAAHDRLTMTFATQRAKLQEAREQKAKEAVARRQQQGMARRNLAVSQLDASIFMLQCNCYH